VTVPSALVVIIACFWLAVWAVCLLMTLRFVVILVAAGMMQTWESFRRRGGKREEGGGQPLRDDSNATQNAA